MIDPKIFYKSYNDDYHKFKIDTLATILKDLPKYEKEFFGGELCEEDHDAYKKTLQSELRQTYYHSVETFFELFFALDPTDKLIFDDDDILFKISNSGFSTYKKIEEICKNQKVLDFLDRKINFHGHDITVGQYIFYYGIFPSSKFSNDVFKQILESINAIKHGIIIIANDFIKREEYNCYKHGLKIIPLLKEIALLDEKTKETIIKWDLSDSMTYYEKSQKGKDEVKFVTKLFDTEKDICMSKFCSNMISQMIFFRKISKFKESIKLNEIPVFAFGKEEIDKCNKNNVSIQDFVWTITRSSD